MAQTQLSGNNSSVTLDASLAFRTDLAANYSGNAFHLSQARTYAYLDLHSHLWESSNHKYRMEANLSERAYYDAIFDLSHRYSGEVRQNEEHQASLRQAVLTLNTPNWTFHIGKQQIIWGEAIGVFIADVVNPKDYRQFLLPDFNDVRIPLWGIDAQRSFGKAGTLELFGSPDMQVSQLPVPGSEFAFYSPPIGLPVDTTYLRPARTLGNSRFGIRYSWLSGGWDSSFFYYRTISDLPAVSSQLLPPPQNPVLGFTEKYPRVNDFAATTTKPLGDFVFKSEAIYSTGQQFQTLDLGQALHRASVSAMAGVSYPFCCQYTADVQYFQTTLLGGASQLATEPHLRSGVSVRVQDAASLRRFKPSLQMVVSPNQHDFWITPKITIRVTHSVFATVGRDWFNGRPDTQFGQFHKASRLEFSLLWKAM